MKRLYFEMSDNENLKGAIFPSIEDCASHIDCEFVDAGPLDDQKEYTIKSVWYTDEEIEKMAEADF